ncbi:MAG: flavin-dependent oxidoreductase [Hyphomonadaceae bacterium]|jgi:2-polyprenyl-6-methoxyphenol hydroxylase-like FAD-dependent oxidoreductase|nr:flavin-dependent oxidoreductase [Hyphomonadaceae bacterium]
MGRTIHRVSPHVIIVGGGIGGLTLALMLHGRGIRCQIYEASPRIRELGVGINVLPHAIAELAELGLLAQLDKVAIRTRELIYANRFGQEIWREPRGLEAGYQVPQFSIHRGHLQGVLRDAAIDRLGRKAIHTGHVLASFAQEEGAVKARFKRLSKGARATVSGDVLVGCDGIHSTVRRQLYPDEAGLKWNGVLMWRGATVARRFLDGRTMIVGGGFNNKLVLYPIAPGKGGKQLINWVVTHRMGDGSSPPPRREDWNRRGTLGELMPHVQRFSTPHVNLPKLVKGAPVFYEYPMADRDPLPRWTHGRVTLLGDAAHPMYPVGSNGASQAILDARCLADLLVSSEHARAALAAYEADRLPKTAEIVRNNRKGGPEGVIDEVERRAPDGFDDIDDVLSYGEREAIVKGYAQLAGFAKEQVNRRRPTGMTATGRTTAPARASRRRRS